jgi:hypothetical protein
MDAMKGTATGCTMVTTSCTTYPCTTGAVTVTLGTGCPLPLGGTGSGSVTVTGNWSNADTAVLSQTYAVAFPQTNQALPIVSVSQVSAARSGNLLTIGYTDTNVVATLAGMAYFDAGGIWNIVVDTKGTADPSDDVFTMNASRSFSSASYEETSSINNVVLDPSCRQNPIAGTGQDSTLSSTMQTSTSVNFHATCDGQAEVNGMTVPLQLLP